MKPPPRLEHLSACVFDAYGTLFDVSSVARGAQMSWATVGRHCRSSGAPSSCNTPG